MAAFIIAGIVFVCTLGWCALIIGADMMSDAGGDGMPVLPPFIIGTAISVLIAASHFMPHLSW